MIRGRHISNIALVVFKSAHLRPVRLGNRRPIILAERLRALHPIPLDGGAVVVGRYPPNFDGDGILVWRSNGRAHGCEAVFLCPVRGNEIGEVRGAAKPRRSHLRRSRRLRYVR